MLLGFPSVRIEPGPYNVEYGQNITLVCNITSNPRHFNVYWSRELNGVTRTTYYDRNITFTPVLLDLIDVTFEESGQYRCHAENDIATGESDPVNVTVYGGMYD